MSLSSMQNKKKFPGRQSGANPGNTGHETPGNVYIWSNLAQTVHVPSLKRENLEEIQG